MSTIQIAEYNTLIDDEDLERILGHTWHVKDRRLIETNLVYFATNIPVSTGYYSMTLHRYIMGCSKNDGKTVDHINGDTLDNRKCNLRICTKGENNRNKKCAKNNNTGYKGVEIKGGKYIAVIRSNRKLILIGSSFDPKECARWYDIMASRLFGEFARLNFPHEVYSNEEKEQVYKMSNSVINVGNTSGYRGVHYYKAHDNYQAYISYKKKRIHIGYFDNPIEAALAYDKKAVTLLGDKAKTNF